VSTTGLYFRISERFWNANASRFTAVAEARFEILTAVKTDVEVFWVVMPCSVVGGYHRFGGPCCLHLQGEEGILPQHYTTSQPRRPWTWSCCRSLPTMHRVLNKDPGVEMAFQDEVHAPE
jgi:hypothetical protein